jgi:hypothetical protein
MDLVQHLHLYLFSFHSYLVKNCMYLGSFSNKKYLSHNFLQSPNLTSWLCFSEMLIFFFIPPHWTPICESHYVYTMIFWLLLRSKAPAPSHNSWYKHPCFTIDFSWMILSCALDCQLSPTFIENGVFWTSLLFLFIIISTKRRQKKCKLQTPLPNKDLWVSTSTLGIGIMNVLALPQMQTHICWILHFHDVWPHV